MYSQIIVTGTIEDVVANDNNKQLALNVAGFSYPLVVDTYTTDTFAPEDSVLVLGEPTNQSALAIKYATVLPSLILPKNFLTVFGYLGNTPELRHSNAGNAYTNGSLCVNGYNDKSWYRFVAFKKTAETLYKYTQKGSLVGLTGEVTEETYKDTKSGKEKSQVQVLVRKLTLIPKTHQKTNQTATNNNDF